MATRVHNTWQKPSPLPLFPLVESKTAAQIAGLGSPIAGMVLYDSTNNKLVVRVAAAWETITSV